ncbi:hypothetical protein E0493_07960 [Roseomonas sp. M0104]|uniref:Polysaccharide pyruvyl transferase domain-containing protein n=1 Tax=Teichococcus coralli TaxID=2545983 RepID=A0A845BB00_9PROT|nr:polysaccharide pyruvyl transferase family protein [Pseudoroseomonas coralli]MXP63286.1 hypothetical protein [Pseudoroseomonas coralli]
MKVTYLTLPHEHDGKSLNLGDRIIYLGARNIVRRAIGQHEEEVRFLSDNESFPSDTDMIVVCGTPQILVGATPSQNLQRILEAANSDVPVKINLGAGAFYFDAFGELRNSLDEAFGERVRQAPIASAYAQYAKFDLCTCRDFAGVAVLKQLGLEPLALPCPGFFSAIFEPRPLFRRQEQLVSVLNGTASFWNRVSGDVHGFFRRLWEQDPTRVFIAHDEQDCAMLSEMGIPFVTFTDADRFLTYLASAQNLLSLRVHGALPAWTLGLNVTLLGIDRRSLLGEDFGARFRVIPLRSQSDFDQALALPSSEKPPQDDDERRAWLSKHLDSYVSSIRQTVREKLGVVPDESVSPDGAGNKPKDEVAEKQYAGSYFREFFYSTQEEFEVGLDLMRSSHSSTMREGELLVKTSANQSTLAFGPYIRIPAGEWVVSADLAIEPLESDFFQAQPENIILMRITKGVPGTELGRAKREVPETSRRFEAVLEIGFTNPSDTGHIEIVFSTVKMLPLSTRISLRNLRLQRK